MNTINDTSFLYQIYLYNMNRNMIFLRSKYCEQHKSAFTNIILVNFLSKCSKTYLTELLINDKGSYMMSESKKVFCHRLEISLMLHYVAMPLSYHLKLFHYLIKFVFKIVVMNFFRSKR